MPYLYKPMDDFPASTRIAPIPVLEAFVSTIKPFEKFGTARIGANIKAYLRDVNDV